MRGRKARTTSVLLYTDVAERQSKEDVNTKSLVLDIPSKGKKNYTKKSFSVNKRRKLLQSHPVVHEEEEEENLDCNYVLKGVRNKGKTRLHVLDQMSTCRFCLAKKFQYESPTFCCDNGKVQLASTTVPNELYLLFAKDNTDDATKFRKKVRAYNSIFAFTSFAVKIDKKLASSNRGVYTFRVQGQIFHSLPPLIPHNDKPSYFQLYFWDSENELINRMKVIDDSELCENVMELLIKTMESNPYVQQLRRIIDFPSIKDLTIEIRKNAAVDQRCYNYPSADQVAAIWVEGSNANIPYDRDILIHGYDGRQHKIKHYYGCYDALQYPLFFPNGENGWHQNIPKLKDGRTLIVHQQNITAISDMQSLGSILDKEQSVINRNNNKMVSCREYYCYKLQMRENDTSLLLYGGRLLQQYAVDMYIKIETTRLDYFRNNQSEMRSEFYQGIVDSINEGEARGSEVGKRIVLPATFIGGPRDMRKRYLDAMALVRAYGKPDLFITMTCNPDWKEITENLMPTQQAQDRPDLTARVFRAKVLDLKREIIQRRIFGEVIAYVYVVEFQKRGLPHIHMLIILKHEFKVNCVDYFDRYVSAELPDEKENPELLHYVVKHMMHGPCGHLNRVNSCMINGSCKNHYPRPFSERTIVAGNGYPIYRRRNDGHVVDVRKSKLNNQWVVPYNSYLLQRYNCHMNVEVCSSVTAVKYLYKYIYKGHDKIAVHIGTSREETLIDEIKTFQDARWVSAQEAMWRIFEFDLNEISPAVINLPLHLPNKQSITFWKHQNLQNVINQEHNSKTMLTEFFSVCSSNVEARTLLYREFPEHYVWDSKGKFWYDRKKRKVIGRINGANPIEGERYYLRLLLNNVRGPRSYDDLLNVSGQIVSSFKEAAQKRGLLESDKSNFECLNEAVSFQMPHALRRLFSTILVYCEPTDVRLLWDTFVDAMAEDLRKKNPEKNDIVICQVIELVKDILESMGKNVNSYDLPRVPIEPINHVQNFPREIQEELSLLIPQEDIEAEKKLNDAQYKAFSTIIECLSHGLSGLFFINGPGGTGKTFLYRALLAKVRVNKDIALATATSGVAASLLPGGRTAHSRFKIPIEIHEESYCTISKQSGLAALLRQTKLIIWDEAPMAKRLAIEAVDRTLQDLTGIQKPFGGKVVVLGGDFMQVLPVIPKATLQETINGCLVKSCLYENMKKLTLTENMRAKTDSGFCDYLLRIGKGIEQTDGRGNVHIPTDMIIKYDVNNEEAAEQKLIDEIYKDLRDNCRSPIYMSTRGILACKNEYVDHLNEKIIDSFPGEPHIYTSFDEAIDDVQNFYPEEFLNSLTPNGMPPHKLKLKENCVVMLLRNLDPADGLCNGTRMVCKAFERHVIHAEINNGHHSGKQVLIPRIPLSPAENEGYPFKFKRKQFPIRLCFAMTINKAQGQTIPNVGIYLPEPVFSHGQLYVALSRGISMATTKVLIRPDIGHDMNDDEQTRNIVYKEVLEELD